MTTPSLPYFVFNAVPIIATNVTNLFTIETAVACLQGDEVFAADVKPRKRNLVIPILVGFIFVVCGNGINFIWFDLTDHKPQLEYTAHSYCAEWRFIIDLMCLAAYYADVKVKCKIELTVNPDEEAQTLFPSALKIAALSMFPEPTRLYEQSTASDGKRW